MLVLVGMLLFLVFHFLACFLYPGSSEFDLHAKGYSFLHNYFCDLEDSVTYDHQNNPGRPWALASLAVLGISSGVFWLRISTIFENIYRWLYLLLVGIAIMCFCLTAVRHDFFMNLSAIAGLPALALLFRQLLRRGFWWCLMLLFLTFILILINYLIWQTNWGMLALPLAQKLAFVVYLFFMVSSLDFFTKRAAN